MLEHKAPEVKDCLSQQSAWWQPDQNLPIQQVGRSSARHGLVHHVWSVGAEHLWAWASAGNPGLQQLHKRGAASQSLLWAAHKDKQRNNRWRQADGGTPGNTENISQHHRQWPQHTRSLNVVKSRKRRAFKRFLKECNELFCSYL